MMRLVEKGSFSWDKEFEGKNRESVEKKFLGKESPPRSEVKSKFEKVLKRGQASK
jgi:hypothetical protein